MILGISGKIGSGKDTVGNIIQYLVWKDKYGVGDSSLTYNEFCKDTSEKFDVKWQVKKFAFKLKQVVSLLTGCSLEDLESQEFKAKQLGEEWNWFRGLHEDSEKHSIWTRLAVTEEAKKHLTFPNRIKPYTYREILQRVGTEAMRNQIHENVWVNALFSEYKSIGYRENQPNSTLEATFVRGEIKEIKGNIEYLYPNWIITDLRFPNELKAIEDRKGISIRVERKWRTYDMPFGKITETRYIPGFDAPEHPSETALDLFQFDYVIDNNGTIEELVEKVKEVLIKEKII